MPTKAILLLTALSVLFLHSYAQECDPIVPVFDVDLSGDPNGYFESPWVQRVGNCCSTTSPDNCVGFIITLNPDAEGIIFDVCDGAISSGAMFYQIDCGIETPVGEVVCLDGEGPHYLTFCKPGNNENTYCITSVSEPEVSDDITLNEGCSGQIWCEGFDLESLQWNSVYPGVTGQYNNFLDCTNCEVVNVMADSGYPEYVDYDVCGYALGGCDLLWHCETVRVYFNPPLEIQITPENPVICFGEETVLAQAIVSGGTPGYTIEWSNGDSGTSTYLTSGSHWVTLDDALDCPGTSANVFIDVQSQPSMADAGEDIEICSDLEFVPLIGTVTGANGGFWSGGNGSYFSDPSNLNNTYFPSWDEVLAGEVELTLTTNQIGNCPVGTDVMTIQFGQITPDITVDVEDISCNGITDGTAYLNLPADYNYTLFWTPSNLPSIQSQTDLGPGSYSVQIVQQNGCDTTLSFIINEPQQLQVLDATLQHPLCDGSEDGSIDLNVAGGVDPCDFFWNFGNNPDPEGNDHVTDLGAGSYSVTVVDDNGCQLEWEGILDDPSPVTIDVDYESQVCYGDDELVSANAEGGTFPYEYVWSNGAPDSDQQEILIIEEVDISVYAIDNNGCLSNSAAVNIQPIILDEADLSMIGGTTVCPGGTATLFADFDGVEPPYFYFWTQNLGSETGYVDYEPTDPGYVYFTVTDLCGNSVMDSVYVDIYEVPNIELPDYIGGGCEPFEVTWDSGLPDQPGDSYSWYLGNGFYSSEPVPTYSFEQAGVYQISLEYTTPDGCEVNSENEGIVEVFDNPNVQLDYDEFVCFGYNETIACNASGGEAPYNYMWSNGFQNTNIQVVNIEDPISMSVFVVDDNGCISPTVDLSIEPITIDPNDLAMTGEATVCPGMSATLFGDFNGNNPPYLYNWSDGLGFNPGYVDYEPDQPGFVYLTVTDYCGNSVVDSVYVDIHEVPDINLPGNFAQGCEPLEVAFDSGIPDLEGDSYNWNFGNGYYSTDPFPNYVYEQPGAYQVSLVYITPDGCVVVSEGSANVSVFANPEIDIDAEPLIAIIDDAEISFMASGDQNGLDYTWDFGNGTYYNGEYANYTFDELGLHYVNLYSENDYGCQATDQIMIQILPLHDIIIPNTFTPDPTGSSGGYYDASALDNNIFFPFTEAVSRFNMKIFNRWGELVFESNDIAYGWDGYYRGQLSQQDVYIYKIEVEFVDGKVVSKIGDVSLIR